MRSADADRRRARLLCHPHQLPTLPPTLNSSVCCKSGSLSTRTAGSPSSRRLSSDSFRVPWAPSPTLPSTPLSAFNSALFLFPCACADHSSRSQDSHSARDGTQGRDGMDSHHFRLGADVQGGGHVSLLQGYHSACDACGSRSGCRLHCVSFGALDDLAFGVRAALTL